MNEKARLVLVSALILIAVVLGLRACGPGRGQLEIRANSLEEALAHQVGQLVRDSVEASGDIVFIPVPALDDLGIAMNERIRAAFKDGLGRRGGDLEEIDLKSGGSGEDFSATAARIYGGQWAEMLLGWAQTHSNAAAVVSLNQFPQGLGPSQLAGLPPIVSVLPALTQEEAKQLVSNFGLHAGILPGEALDRPGSMPQGGSPEELFNAAYEVITP